MKNDSRLSTETFFEVIETLLGFSNSPNPLYQFDKYEKHATVQLYLHLVITGQQVAFKLNLIS